LDAIRIKSAFNIFRVHFWALLVKRFIYIKRDYKGLICEIFLPIAVLALGLLLTLIKFVNEAPIYQINYANMVKEAPSSVFKVDVNQLAGTSALFNNMNTETGNKMTL
jgi:ATP-binding cassette, subfamily A (ABC1), member 3